MTESNPVPCPSCGEVHGVHEISDDDLGILALGMFAGMVQMDNFPIMLDPDLPFPEVRQREGYFIFQTASGLKFKTTVERVE